MEKLTVDIFRDALNQMEKAKEDAVIRVCKSVGIELTPENAKLITKVLYDKRPELEKYYLNYGLPNEMFIMQSEIKQPNHNFMLDYFTLQNLPYLVITTPIA